MTTEIRQFLIDSLADMNYDVTDLDDDQQLGPAGLDLESLAIAEIALRFDDQFGVKFGDEEAAALSGMTVAEFCAAVAERLPAKATSGE
jgi:acyl carrier protein